MVSIIVPCYNHEKYIAECLKSLIAQTYQNIELIIIDDCSSDSSFNILLEWKEVLKKRFSNVIIQKNEYNLGVVKTLNKMIDMSNGKYIKAIASDDMLLPNSIHDFVTAAEKDDADMYFSNVAFVGSNVKYEDVVIQKLQLRYMDKPQDGEHLTGVLCGENYISAPGAFIPKDTFKKYGKYDTAYCLEDFEFWLRISVDGCIRYVDSITALYRQNENSLSRFDTSAKAIQRHQKFSRDKIHIFFKYQKYANRIQTEYFFNSELDSAIGINDRIMVKEISGIMKKENLKISMYNSLRIPLVNMRVYVVLKKIKQKFK